MENVETLDIIKNIKLPCHIFVSHNSIKMSGEVGRSWRYCNARPTRDKAGASS